MVFKSKVHAACMEVVNQKIQFLKEAIADLVSGGENDSKSSVGDKHETARAMIQAEQEKLSHQLEEVVQQKAVLTKINLSITHAQIGHGSLIKTNTGYLFLSVALGKITVDQVQVFTLSPASPLGRKLLGMKTEQTVQINDLIYKVEEIR